MSLHDAVRINCKKGVTTENYGADVKYICKGVNVDDGVCVIIIIKTSSTGPSMKNKIVYKLLTQPRTHHGKLKNKLMEATNNLQLT